MALRAVVVWFVLLVGAILNGVLREVFITPIAGPARAHVLSTFILCFVILAIAWMTTPWIRPRTRRDAMLVGAGWLALTLAFEFLAGHYVFGHPWSRLTADYNILRGRVWILVLLTTAAAPLWAWRTQSR